MREERVYVIKWLAKISIRQSRWSNQFFALTLQRWQLWTRYVTLVLKIPHLEPPTSSRRLKNMLKPGKVLLDSFGKDNYVVEIDLTLPEINITHIFLSYYLECGRGISQSKAHAIAFKEFKRPNRECQLIMSDKLT